MQEKLEKWLFLHSEKTIFNLTQKVNRKEQGGFIFHLQAKWFVMSVQGGAQPLSVLKVNIVIQLSMSHQ